MQIFPYDIVVDEIVIAIIDRNGTAAMIMN